MLYIIKTLTSYFIDHKLEGIFATLCWSGASRFRLWSELVERNGKGERVGEAIWSSGRVLTGASWFWSELTCYRVISNFVVLLCINVFSTNNLTNKLFLTFFLFKKIYNKICNYSNLTNMSKNK